MIRLFGLLRGCAIAIGAAALFGCTGNNLPEGQPSFYQDLAGPAAALNALPIPWVEPADISNAVLWLASDEARYVTGVALPVDAGIVIK